MLIASLAILVFHGALVFAALSPKSSNSGSPKSTTPRDHQKDGLAIPPLIKITEEDSILRVIRKAGQEEKEVKTKNDDDEGATFEDHKEVYEKAQGQLDTTPGNEVNEVKLQTPEAAIPGEPNAAIAETNGGTEVPPPGPAVTKDPPKQSKWQCIVN
jgi:hypothetical protein